MAQPAYLSDHSERSQENSQESDLLSSVRLTSLIGTLRSRWHPDPYAWTLGILTSALYITYGIVQWKAFLVPSWDLGIFTQLAQRYAHLQAPIVDIKGPGFNLLGDHFHPLLVLLGPIYRLFPSGLTLLVIQALLFGWSVVPITRYARTRLGSLWGTLLGLSYAVSWGLTEAVSAQFHEIAFAVPLLAFGLVFWLEGKNTAAFATLGLLVFVKEDLGLTLAMGGFVLLWLQWGETSRTDFDDAGAHRPLPLRTWASLKRTLADHRSTPGLAAIVWGVLWFVAATVIILPLLNPNGGWDYTHNIGETDGTAGGLLGFFTSLFGPGQKIVTVGLLLIAMGVIGLLSPLWWLMLPTLAWRFAGNVQYYWGWEWHYSAILMPIAALALVDGIDRFRRIPGLRDAWRTRIAGGAVVVSLVGSLAMFWTGGPMGSLLRGEMTQSGSRISGAQGALEAVGTGKNVVSDISLLAYLVPSNTVYWEGSVADAAVDTIVIGPYSSTSESTSELPEWAHLTYGGTWELVYSAGGYTVLSQTSAASSSVSVP